MGANRRNNVANTLGTKIGKFMFGDVCFDGIIEWARHGAGAERKGDRDDKIAVFFGGIEDALAIGEFKIGVSEGFKSFIRDVVDIDAGEDLGELLSVGADILDGGGSGEAGNFRESLNSS